MDENEAFEKLKEKIHTERGLDVSQYKENYLKRRIAVRTRALQINTYAGYIEFLEKNKNEYNELFDRLTINVTQFFRDPEVFIELENTILPEILENKARLKNSLKIWSAGCSTGEEPYSVAISIEETLTRMNLKIPYKIYATDLDESALKAAKEGIYQEKTMENMAQIRKSKYFSYNNGKYIISNYIKDNIKFINMNLMEPFLEKFFDIILCRNVIIYFTRELQKRVMKFFYDSLAKNGILILGKTETMLIDFRTLFQCINIKERIFKKS